MVITSKLDIETDAALLTEELVMIYSTPTPMVSGMKAESCIDVRLMSITIARVYVDTLGLNTSPTRIRLLQNIE
jgi:hypothetical protein